MVKDIDFIKSIYPACQDHRWTWTGEYTVHTIHAYLEYKATIIGEHGTYVLQCRLTFDGHRQFKVELKCNGQIVGHLALIGAERYSFDQLWQFAQSAVEEHKRSIYEYAVRVVIESTIQREISLGNLKCIPELNALLSYECSEEEASSIKVDIHELSDAG